MSQRFDRLFELFLSPAPGSNPQSHLDVSNRAQTLLMRFPHIGLVTEHAWTGHLLAARLTDELSRFDGSIDLPAALFPTNELSIRLASSRIEPVLAGVEQRAEVADLLAEGQSSSATFWASPRSPACRWHSRE